jgi:hypothetical protein
MCCYEIEKINSERSSRKCLMVIKERISEGIWGVIPECETDVDRDDNGSGSGQVEQLPVRQQRGCG